MAVETNKKEAGTVSMSATQQPPGVYISEDMSYRGEGEVYIGGVVHGQEKAGQELNS